MSFIQTLIIVFQMSIITMFFYHLVDVVIHLYILRVILVVSSACASGPLVVSSVCVD